MPAARRRANRVRGGNPASTSRQVSPDSTSKALPLLPLPNERTFILLSRSAPGSECFADATGKQFIQSTAGDPSPSRGWEESSPSRSQRRPQKPAIVCPLRGAVFDQNGETGPLRLPSLGVCIVPSPLTIGEDADEGSVHTVLRATTPRWFT